MQKIIIFNSGSTLYGSERGLLNVVKSLEDEHQIVVVLPGRGVVSDILSEHKVSVKIFPLCFLSFSISPVYHFKNILIGILDLIYFFFFIKREKADIVYTNNLLLLFPAILAKVTGKEHIWHVREFFHLKILNDMLAGLVKCLSGKIICQSENIRNVLFPQKLDKLKVIYEGIDIKEYQKHSSCLSDRPELFVKNTVFTVYGRIHPSKGQYEFLRLVSRLNRERLKKMVVLIVGGYSSGLLRDFIYRKKMEKFIEEKELSENVIFLGFCRDIRAVLDVTDVCVFPIQRNEPFGISLLEAFVFSKAILYNPNPGSLEISGFFKDKAEELTLESVKRHIDQNDKSKKKTSYKNIFPFKEYKKNLKSFLEER